MQSYRCTGHVPCQGLATWPHIGWCAMPCIQPPLSQRTICCTAARTSQQSVDDAGDRKQTSLSRGGPPGSTQTSKARPSQPRGHQSPSKAPPSSQSQAPSHPKAAPGNSQSSRKQSFRGRRSGVKPEQHTQPSTPGQRWRLYQVVVPFSTDPGKDDMGPNSALAAAVEKRLKCRRSLPVSSLYLVRKSFDSRAVIKGQRSEKRWVYVVDVEETAAVAAGASLDRLTVGPGQLEVLTPETEAATGAAPAATQKSAADRGAGSQLSQVVVPTAKAAHPVVVVGSGPAGLFAALTLAEAGVPVLVLERGQPVEQRGRDIGALLVRGILNPDSNLCYGEGGAGTWSDGKLATKIGRNSDPVRAVLRALVSFGAPESILVSGKPHLGTDRLVLILKSLRSHLMERLGAQIRFGVSVEDLEVSHGRVTGVKITGSGEVIPASAVVLAVGHSARGMYRRLHARDVSLTPKPFAMGFRVEHPQSLIDTARYGEDHAAMVERGKGKIPVADYKLNVEVPDDTWSQPEGRTHPASSSQAHVSQPPNDFEPTRPQPAAPAPSAPQEKRIKGQLGGTSVEEYGGSGRPVPAGMRGVFSFCMCPGGQIVCTSTKEEELCLNGMSFSRRNSVWANSALVCNINPSDWTHHVATHGPLAGVALQEEIEREAARRGGGNLHAPVQRVVDFLSGDLSTGTLPSSSYRLGVRSATLHDIYPDFVGKALTKALSRFERTIPGFMSSPEALLHGVETRTSAPIRIDRDPETLESPSLMGLYPSGEGAGYAGGIVSAAVDGLRVGEAVLAALVPSRSTSHLA